MKWKSSPKSSWLSAKRNRKTCVLELKNSLSNIGLMLASLLQRASKKSIRSTRLWPRWTLRQRQMQSIVVEATLVGMVSVGVAATVPSALASVPIADLDVVAVVAVVAAVAVLPRPMLKPKLTLKLKQMLNVAMVAAIGVIIMATTNLGATTDATLESR